MTLTAPVRFAVAAVALAAAAAVIPTPAATVERVFSTGVYPVVQRTLTWLTNAVPIAMLDVWLVIAVVCVPTAVYHAFRQRRLQKSWQPVITLASALVAAVAIAYLLFLGLWGLNYRRVPIEARIALERPVPTDEDVLRLGITAVRQMNALWSDAREEGWRGNEWHDVSLRTAHAQVQAALTGRPAAVPGRLKHTVLGLYFRWTGVDGMINPYGLEVVINPDLLPFERPFVAAHEWAHLAGFADESEANFIGWLTCIRATAASRYSGWLYLYWQLAGEVSEEGRRQLWDQMSRGPRRDVESIIDRLQRGRLPLLQRASWLVYDQYLKANRVEEGVRNYGLVVNLILRARFDETGMPVHREN